MSRLKSVFAIAVLIAAVGASQAAHAQVTLKVLIVGASGTWQNLATATYKAGHCPTGARGGNAIGNCGHASYGKPTAVNLIDTRMTPNATDTGGSLWVVWDNVTADPNCTTACNVWAYMKVDSIVGNRCFFATPRCTVKAPSFTAVPDQLIGCATCTYWETEKDMPATVKALFTTGHVVTVGASEIRPEDAAFGQCRINSVLGGGDDGLNGLGYGNNASGVCPTFASPFANKSGTDLVSAYPASTSVAHPLAFNISGHDPFTNSVIPVFSTVNIGAVPVMWMVNGQSATGLQNLTDVTLPQLQKVFSGGGCLASDLGVSGGTDALNVFLREPLSGTMNSAEYTAFRLPVDSSGNHAGISQETSLSSAGVGITPVSNLGCGPAHGLPGHRYQSVGQGDMTKFILHSNDGTLPSSTDGIGYVFAGYGNWSTLAHSAATRYVQINGVDPFYQLYGSNYDPGEAIVNGAIGAGAMPNGSTDIPAICAHTFPCSEKSLWAGHLSYPNVRNGSYRQWIMVRLMGTTGGAPLAAATALITSAQASAVATIPDYVPAAAVTVTLPAGEGGGSFTDPGLKLLHAHYTQDGVAPVNATEKGGDEGGCIIPSGSVATKLVYNETGCSAGN